MKLCTYGYLFEWPKTICLPFDIRFESTVVHLNGRGNPVGKKIIIIQMAAAVSSQKKACLSKAGVVPCCVLLFHL